MAILDNAIWLTGTGATAANGTTVITDGAESTTVTGTFTAGIWDASQTGYAISEFGAFGLTTPASMNYDFSDPVEDISFDFNHISDDGGSTYDDKWTIYIYDTNGVLIPAADVIAAFSGMVDENVYANPDGSVSIEAEGTASSDVNFTLSGYQISSMELVLEPGSGGTQTGGTGISDISFTIPVPDGTVEGTPGNDTIDAAYAGDPEGDLVDANDAILAGDTGDDDLIYGFGGDDTITAGNGDDEVYAGTGDDTLSGDAGNDSLFGGDGDDTIVGGTGDDVLYGSAGNDSLFGGADNDTLNAGNGNDLLDGGTGNDVFDVDDGDEVSSIIGGTGFDTIKIDNDITPDGFNVIFTGDNEGTLSAVSGSASGTFIEIEAIQGSIENDTVDVSADSTGISVSGDAGDDIIIGGSGNDVFDGGTGADTIAGGAGADTINGGSGDDSITFSEGDSVDGGTGDDTFILENLGEQTNGTITIVGGSGGETPDDGDPNTPEGDTLQLGTGADLSTLIKVSNGLNVNGNETFSGSVQMDDGTLLNFSEIENIICFTPGTQIATPFGARDIASLKVGDLVVTRDHGLQPIRWIQSRIVPAIGRFAPIRIRPGAVTGLNRDLLVSPQHRMLFQGYRAELLFGEREVLVSATHMVDGKYVTQDEGGTVTYIHMMFDEHEIVFADGAASESFHPGLVGLDGVTEAAREELFGVFPELRTNTNGYGTTARRCLKRHEAELVRF